MRKPENDKNEWKKSEFYWPMLIAIITFDMSEKIYQILHIPDPSDLSESSP